MQQIDVVYLYEHIARELDVACAIKFIAEQHYGMRVELVQWPSGLPRAFRQFRPRVVVLSYCFTAENFSSILLEWRKSVFFNLGWEQLFCDATREQKTPNDGFARQHVIQHAWSDDFAGYLQEQGIPKENIFVNGHPAYMLYEEPYRRYFKQRFDLASQYALEMNKKWIFFPENFGWAFYSDARMEEWVRAGMNRDSAFAMRQFARLSLEKAMQWCEAIANKNNVELIIRPRPATPLDDFKTAVHQIIGAIPERMRLIKDGSVREWILASDVVISSYSTSLIEAALAGKRSYLLEPFPIPKFLHVDWHDYVPHVKTRDECASVCLEISPMRASHQLANWARATMLARGDAIWNLADFLARICGGKISLPAFPSRKTVTQIGRFRLPRWALFEYRKIRYKKARRHKPKQILTVHEQDYVDPIVIEQRTSKWKDVLAGYDHRKSKQTTMQSKYSSAGKLDVLTQPRQKPMVSVIIIFLNAQKFITEAIESVFAQTYRNWELLLVDDGSTDASTDMARRYAQQHSVKVRYLEHEGHQNQGMSASRNLAIRSAAGEYIAFLDSDDVWLPHKLEQQIAILESQPDAAMVYGPPLIWYSWSGNAQDRQDDFIQQDLGVPLNTLVKPPTLVAFFLEKAKRGGTPLPSGMMLRRDAIKLAGGFEESFRGMFEDMVFNTKLCLAAPVFVANACWLKYRQHPEACCTVGTSTGRFHGARLNFLNWLEAYLLAHGMKGSEVWKILQRKFWPYRYPIRYRLFNRVQSLERRIKDLVFLF
jgi:surface carbohydrate biosynthesis protein